MNAENTATINVNPEAPIVHNCAANPESGTDADPPLIIIEIAQRIPPPTTTGIM